ncbi:restriction endonuclease subunit S [Exiguobacterium sp. SH0S1]|uniref:restriction endonuclease subunit S n=1 Tax=Exiguobacterium sp. SH0S1 TaxID=2510949 RepID=UPI001F01C579|nr:restriction endonuclease subunit S [Exiguobacterium sp. SH0S1]
MKSAFDYINEMNRLWFQYTPNEWEIKNLGHVSKMIVPMRDKPTSFDGTIPWVRIEDFDGKYISDSKSKQYVSEEFIKSMNLKVFPKGTVMCTCSCTMGATAIVEQPLVSNQTFIGIVPGEKLNSEYLYYLMQASADRLQMFSQGAIQQYLSRHDFEHLKVPLPSIENQKTIKDFLNKKLENLDKLIQNKNNLLKLLEQQCQSIITEAITKGLNPNVEMKDSGVEWIGEIPEHWEVRKIKDVANVYSSNIDKKSVEGEKEVLLCNYVDVYYNDSITANLDFMKATAKVDQIKTFTLKKHDVIITKDSESPTDIAIPTWVSQDLDGVVCGYHLSLIRCAESVLGHYLYYNLESVQIREQFYTRANGVTRYGLSKEAIKMD